MQAYFLQTLSANTQLDLKNGLPFTSISARRWVGRRKAHRASVRQGATAAPGARVPPARRPARWWPLMGTWCQPEPQRFGSARPRCWQRGLAAKTQVQQRAETAVPTKGSVSDAARGFSPADSGELQKERRDLWLALPENWPDSNCARPGAAASLTCSRGQRAQEKRPRLPLPSQTACQQTTRL